MLGQSRRWSPRTTGGTGSTARVAVVIARPRASTSPGVGGDGGDDLVEVGEHGLVSDAEDFPPELGEEAVPVGVTVGSVVMGGPVRLDEEAEARRPSVEPADPA
jgi:hypothetical protein